MNGLSCAFHDLRHTLATMMMAGGRDVRTAASCLGHVSASMAPDIHADVDPEAKRAAVDRVAGSFDVGLGSLCDFPSPPLRRRALAPAAPTFSVEQLSAMLASAEGKGASRGRP